MWSSSDSKEQVWAGPLSGGSVAVILLNLDDSNTSTITTDFKTIGIQSQQASARDLWLRKDAREGVRLCTPSWSGHVQTYSEMSGWLKGTLRSFAGSTANHRYAHITIEAG